MSKSLYLLMILSFMVALGGCDDSEDISVPKHAPTYSVKMGGIFPFTGSNKGKPRNLAALLAVKHLNQAGFSVGWAVADSKNNPDAGIIAARDLIEKGKVQVIIGASSSDVTIAIAEQVTIPNEVPQISYSSTAPKITNLENNNSDFLFRTAVPDGLQGRVLAKLAFDAGYKSVSVLYTDNAYGQGLNEVFTNSFEKLGGEVVAAAHKKIEGSDLVNNAEARDILRPALQKVYTGETEALIAMSYSQYAEFFLPIAIESYSFNQFLFADAIQPKDVEDAIRIEGINNLNRVCGTSPGDEQTESLDIFKESYKEEYGELPTGLYQPNVYDAVVVAGLAAYAAQAIGKSITPLAIRDYLRRVNDPDGQKVIAGAENLKRALKMLDSGVTINYEGASGNVDFDENGDVIAPIDTWCYEGGEIVYQKDVQPDV